MMVNRDMVACMSVALTSRMRYEDCNCWIWRQLAGNNILETYTEPNADTLRCNSYRVRSCYLDLHR